MIYYELLNYEGVKGEFVNYNKIAKEIGELVTEKQKAYGDSFNKSCEIVKILYPEGISPDQYKDLLTTVRIIDKLFRIATKKDAFGESPYRDIAGYGLLGTAHDLEEKEETPGEIQELLFSEKA